LEESSVQESKDFLGLRGWEELLASPVDLESRLDRLLQRAMEILGAERGSIMLVDDPYGELVVTIARGWEGGPYRVPLGQGIAGWVAEHGEPLIINGEPNDPRFRGTNPEIKSALAMPLRVANRVIGVLNLSSLNRRRFTPGDMERLGSFAELAAALIENSRLYRYLLDRQGHLEHELDMASRIQRSIVKTRVPCASVRIASRLIPASAVGGDFFSVIPLDRESRYCFYCPLEVQERCQALPSEACPRKFGIMIGDVADKGMPAALIMSVLTAVLYEVGKHQVSPALVLEEVNSVFRRFFSESQYGFATLFYGFYDDTEGSLTYVRAGHEPPIHLDRSTGKARFLGGEGFPVGLMDRGEYQEVRVKLGPGDRVVLYTDGLTGARNRRGQVLGRERLLRMVEQFADKGVEEFLGAVADEMMVFTGDAPQPDDVAVMVMELEDRYDLSLTFRSDRGKVRDVVETVMAEVGDLGPEKGFALRLCLEEVINNAMEHGNRKDPEKAVYLVLKKGRGELTVKVRDEGEGFDYRAWESSWADRPLLSERGRGLVLVRHYADGLEFRGDGNEVVLSFRL
jgi:sigma-B regulation protein RsbU (phosphoserine phosphatase)